MKSERMAYAEVSRCVFEAHDLTLITVLPTAYREDT